VHEAPFIDTSYTVARVWSEFSLRQQDLLDLLCVVAEGRKTPTA